MIIGIDANEANVEKRVGSGQYAFYITENLIAGDKENTYKIYLKQPPRFDFPQPSGQVQYEIFGPRRFWTQFALPAKLYFGRRPTVFFSPAHYAPRFSPIPTVITIHDLSFFKYPNYFLKKDLHQLKSWTAYSVKKARKIITPSESAKHDIVSYYGYSDKDIVVVPHGYDKMRFHENLESAKINVVKQTYGIEEDYILYLGTLQPRKNLNTMIEAFAQVLKSSASEVQNDKSSNLEPLTSNLKLVIAGKKGWLFASIFAAVKKLHIENRVIFTDYVKDEDVPYLYAGSLGYILPSLYEGFGMPIIEAMACGVIAAGSNTSSIPEVIGPGFLFDPSSSQDIAHVLRTMINLPSTERAKKRQAGIAFAKQFSWEKAARETLSVLEKAVA